MTTPEPAPAMEFDCPLCGGAFEADLTMLGQEVECPHCGQVVELPDRGSLEGTAGEGGVEPSGVPELAPEAGHAQAKSAPQEPAPSRESAVVEAPPAEPRANAAAAPERPRPLTREERAAARRRFNLILAGLGAVILVLTFVLLVNLT